MAFEFRYNKKPYLNSEYVHSLLVKSNIRATRWAEKILINLFYNETSFESGSPKDSNPKCTDLMKTILFQSVHMLNEMYIRHFDIELIQPDMNLHQILDHIILGICKKSSKNTLTDIDILEHIPNVIECEILRGYTGIITGNSSEQKYMINLKPSDWWSSSDSFEKKYILSDEVNEKFCNFLYSLGKYLHESSELGIISLEDVVKDIPVIEEKEAQNSSIIERIQFGCVAVVKEELVKKIKEYHLQDRDEIPIYLVLKAIQNNSFWKTLNILSKQINREYRTFTFPKKLLECSGRNILYDGTFYSVNFPRTPISIYQMIEEVNSLSPIPRETKDQKENNRREYYALIWSRELSIELPRIFKGRFIINFDR